MGSNGNGHSTTGLRTDGRQWLIYGDESMGALIRGLEAMALQMAGQTLRHTPLLALRGLGTLMVRVSAARLAEMYRNDGAQRVVVEHLRKVMAAMAGHTTWTDDAQTALDELHAINTHTDSRAAAAGVYGPGTVRQGIRGD